MELSQLQQRCTGSVAKKKQSNDLEVNKTNSFLWEGGSTISRHGSMYMMSSRKSSIAHSTIAFVLLTILSCSL